MARNALSAPAHIIPNRPALGNLNNSPDIAPSLVFAGNGILDDRLIYNSANSSAAGAVIGWYGQNPIVIDQVPSTISASAVAAAQVPTAGTPLTLVAATGAGVTVLTTTFLALPSLVTMPVGMHVLDGVPGYVRVGYGNFTAFYDPTKMLSRNLQFTCTGDHTGGTYTVAGYDVYGFPMTETVTGVNGAIAAGKKAWKFITSITPAGTLPAANVAVGQADVIGLPIAASTFGQLALHWNSTTVTATTGFLAGVTTNPSTAVLGDVRGTYALQVASNNTLRFVLSMKPSINLITNATNGIRAGLWGVVQA